jgi:hypothetical protein
MHILDLIATHVAYILSEAAKVKGKGKGKGRYTIEPSEKAAEDWSMQVMMRAGAFAGVRGCTPGIVNGEGKMDVVKSEVE